MKAALLAGLALAVTACATVPPGEDPKGKQLKAEAAPVLTALVSYQKDHGAYPRSLHELVPKYLREVPFGPGLRYDADGNGVAFGYSPSGPAANDVVCEARPGDLDWSCHR